MIIQYVSCRLYRAHSTIFDLIGISNMSVIPTLKATAKVHVREIIMSLSTSMTIVQHNSKPNKIQNHHHCLQSSCSIIAPVLISPRITSTHNAMTHREAKQALTIPILQRTRDQAHPLMSNAQVIKNLSQGHTRTLKP
jgi:hypothetical protein